MAGPRRVRPGWPGEPHDPADVGDSVLRPPQRGTPGRRRGMADIIDGELADMRGRSMEDYIEAERQDAYNMGDTDPSPPPARLIDMRGRIPRYHPTHQAVDRALAGAWSLAATTRPPPGSVRVRTASPGKARLVRANGDGWTLIGRTDGPVVLLTDAIPGIPGRHRRRSPPPGTALCPDRSRRARCALISLSDEATRWLRLRASAGSGQRSRDHREGKRNPGPARGGSPWMVSRRLASALAEDAVISSAALVSCLEPPTIGGSRGRTRYAIRRTAGRAERHRPRWPAGDQGHPGSVRGCCGRGAELRPDHPAAAISLDAVPVAQAGDNIEAAADLLQRARIALAQDRPGRRSAIGDGKTYGHPGPAQLDREEATAAAAGMPDCVGCQLSRAQGDVVTLGIAGEEFGDKPPGLTDLVFLTLEDPAPPHRTS